MKLERRNEGTTDRDHGRIMGGSEPRADGRGQSTEDEVRLDSRDSDDPYYGKSDGEMLARYAF